MNADFQHYLESVCHTYQHWWEKYTITDVEGRRQNSPFEGLMVATVSPKQDNRGDTQEKTERLPVQEGLRKYAENHVLLVGKPGSGKSTALAQMLFEEAEKAKSRSDSGCIPVLVELRQYQTSVLDLIQSFLQRHGLYDVEIKTLLRNRQLLLLVDGVNELPNEEARRELKTFRINNPKTPMIFTTRDLGVGSDLGIEQKLEMQPLTEEQMQQFIRAYLPETGEEMLRRLGERLRSFGKTPLLLWMFCDLFQQTNNIPPNLGLVFRQFTQFYADKIKDDVRVVEELRGWWKESLEALAFTMMQGETPTELRVIIDRLEAEEILTKFLEGKVDYPPTRAKELLKDLLKHHLIQISSNEKIEFRHQLLQEYYAAECLLQKLTHISNEKLTRDYLNYLKWTEPLALMLALVEKEAPAVGVVKLALEVDLELGARLAGEVKPEFQKKTVDLILELEVSELLKIEFLTSTRSKHGVAFLINGLQNVDSHSYIISVKASGKITASQAVVALIHVLNYQDSDVHINAALALGEIKGDQAVSALIYALNRQDIIGHTTAMKVLGKITDSQAVATLIYALNDQDSDVRRLAAEVLGKIKDSQAVSSLIHALNDQDSDVRRNAALALGEIKDSQAVAALIHALNDQDFYVRGNAALALGEIKDSQAVAALIQALNDQNSNVRRNAALALGEIKDSQAVAALTQALNDQNSNVRINAASALGEIYSSEILPQMWKLRLAGVDYAKNVISKIQERYKFYNHEIFHSPSIKNATQTESKTMQYQDFQILIDKNHQIRASSEQGDVSAELRLDINEIELALELIELNKTNDKLLKSLGNQLYQALFPNQINARFHATMAGAQANQESVRLRLIFQSPQLAALPWEFLYDAETTTFLGNNIQTVLSRYIDVPLQKRDIKTAKLPLKVLLVISSPTDLAPLDATGEATLINSALETHIKAGQIELDIIKEATTRNINQKLREKPYNIFHFIGHGVFKDNKGYIALEDNNKQAKLMDENGFADFFLGYRSLGLAVLNSCKGAEVSEQQIFTGIAPNLVQRGIPAVVAMQYSIRDTTAKIFADEFYRTLALGYPVDAAIQTTRNAISQEVGLNQRDFATPVLYMRAKDGIILDFSA
ncbi:HEAT repeat domain-containing protein [Calothrix sp. FACHB-1219]|uniref:HEAT repeat domain-containing protein n=1 Tax=unclassified Calothrix TaxID=2619626 RepID=UPI001688CF2C|nr:MULTISPECIES: HEAT repeat domain-containing protein [unclassified Calothrix]MBD2207496.1 HEAT repeat domain-containing protein [Calothrix sp. FACHB-168]MBD2222097.1 HEAT repeat domain-containing protein [Calothrix sp. FACHB-1219]